MTVNMGPVAPAYPSGPMVPNPVGYNPRCLTRDLSTYVAKNYMKESLIVDLITQSKDIGAFQTTLQGDVPRGVMSLHAAGHLVFNADPGFVGALHHHFVPRLMIVDIVHALSRTCLCHLESRRSGHITQWWTGCGGFGSKWTPSIERWLSPAHVRWATRPGHLMPPSKI